MRWLFLILLLANAVLYGWFHQEAQRRALQAERARTDLGDLTPLVRVGEAEPGQLQLRRPPRAPAQPSPASAPDVPVAASTAASTASVGTGAASAAQERPAQCFRVGPFATESAARSFADQLTEEVPDAALVAGRLPLEPEYRVYVLIEDAAKQARLQQELRADGLETYLMPQGELSGHLSVGLYRNEAAAEALLKALRAKDYPARQRVYPRYEPVYYVDLKPARPALWINLWHEHLAAANPLLKNEKKSCEGVATGNAPE